MFTIIPGTYIDFKGGTLPLKKRLDDIREKKKNGLFHG